MLIQLIFFELKVELCSVKELKFINIYIDVQVNVFERFFINSKFYDFGCYVIIKDYYII